MQENELEINEVVVEDAPKKQKKADTHFLVGFFGGMLVAIIAIGLGVLGSRLYRCYKISKAFDQVMVLDPTVVSGNRELIDSRLISKLGTIENIFDKYYFDEYTTDEIEEGIYSGMVDALGDKYSTYYSAEEMKQLQQDSGGYYCGIGAYVSYDEENEICVFAGNIEGSPAEAAGIREGDMIYQVDGTDMQGLTSDEVVTYIRGDEGTNVHIAVIRDGELVEFDITRARVDTQSVGYEMLDDNIGHIAIGEFDANTADQFTEALAILLDEGARGMIIDVRSNLGGNFDVACEIARYILPEGLITYTMDKYGLKNEFTCDGSNELKIPLVVLVNGHSASASEILTGAVKDNNAGTIMGTKTYGKGIVQTVIPLKDGSAVKVTRYKYYTPSGVCIHGEGIEPDIVVEFDADAYYNDSVDNQLNAAVDEIHKQWESSN